MAKINIRPRTEKKRGKIYLSFRLTDRKQSNGKKVDISCKSEILADIEELTKFNSDGTPKPRANYNRQLKAEIQERMLLMEEVYSSLLKSGIFPESKTFNEALQKRLFPEQSEEKFTLLNAFEEYIKNSKVGKDRKRDYKVMFGILERFLTISNKLDIKCSNVEATDIRALEDFIKNEWEYTKQKKWGYLYENARIQKKPRTKNTASKYIKMIEPFFQGLEDAEVITKSPFKKLGKENLRRMKQAQYSKVIPLLPEEFNTIYKASVPEHLQEVRLAFLLHCALGCRVGDYGKLTLDNVSVSKEGIPYVHYYDSKNKGKNTIMEEIETPLVKYAFDIIKATEFKLPIRRNLSGQNGYNKQLKKLFQYLKLDRQVSKYNETKGENETFFLYDIITSHFARRFIEQNTLSNNISTLTGLHKDGSDAIKRYADPTLADRFKLLSTAFNQPLYKVDNKLNIIEE